MLGQNDRIDWRFKWIISISIFIIVPLSLPQKGRPWIDLFLWNMSINIEIQLRNNFKHFTTTVMYSFCRGLCYIPCSVSSNLSVSEMNKWCRYMLSLKFNQGSVMFNIGGKQYTTKISRVTLVWLQVLYFLSIEQWTNGPTLTHCTAIFHTSWSCL